MRAGGCTVQQSLTSEAANVVKQAVGLARRRGHAQVTPLHVANTMLSASTGLFRTACLQSRSHPLQCRALELCFNVALNRLPASTSGPMMGSHQHHPSISNALVAAFRRAQAHQRRGSIESQQQPLLAVKIELEQLIISILDDPSVSRVMREAGFSSTQVKSNVEQAVSLELCNNTETQTSTNPKNPSDPTKIHLNNEDVMFVIDNIVKRTKRSAIIVGDSVASMEGVVRGVMEKIDKGDVDEALRGVKFVNLSLVSFARLARDEVERKLEELRRLVNSYMAGGGVVLFLGDLKWTAEFRSSTGSADRRIGTHYCPVEHVVMEIGKLVSRIGESNKRFWLMGIATFHTYQTCKAGHLSLETVWRLSPLTIPSRSLRLSLISDSDEQSGYSSKKGQNGCATLHVDLDGEDDEEMELNCCPECSAKYESEAQSLRNRACNNKSSSTLPAWLQHYKNQNKPPSTTANDQDRVSLKDLCKKWSSICSSIHRHHRKSHDYSENTLTFSSVMSPSSTFSYHQDHPNPYPVLHRNMSWPQHIINHSWTASEPSTAPEPAGLRMYLPDHDSNQPPPFSGFSASTPTSACSSDVMEVEYVHKFKELNAETLKTLRDALDKTVPSHKLIVPEIATAILRCRSGLVRRKDSHPKEDTWLFFLGADVAAKETVARELARLVFGSRSSFVSVSLSSFSSTRSDQDCKNKRSRDDRSGGYVERFADAVAEDPHRLFFIEDVEQADWCSRVGFRRAVESGRVTSSGGEEVVLRDAIVVLSCERLSSRSRGCSSDEEDGKDGNYKASSVSDDHEKSPCVSLDLNMSIDDDSVDDCDVDHHSIDDIGLVEAVDAMVVFKVHDL